MAFWKKSGNKQNEKKEPCLAAVIWNTASSKIYQELLRENGIPFICTQQGASGYLKHVIGRAFIPDNIYVNEEDFDRACEIYRLYIENEEQLEIPETEEE